MEELKKELFGFEESGVSVFLGGTCRVSGMALEHCQRNGIWFENSLVAKNHFQHRKKVFNRRIVTHVLGLLDDAYTKIHRLYFYSYKSRSGELDPESSLSS